MTPAIDVRIRRVVVEPGHGLERGRLSRDIAQALRLHLAPESRNGEGADRRTTADLIAWQIARRLPAQLPASPPRHAAEPDAAGGSS